LLELKSPSIYRKESRRVLYWLRPYGRAGFICGFSFSFFQRRERLHEIFDRDFHDSAFLRRKGRGNSLEF